MPDPQRPQPGHAPPSSGPVAPSGVGPPHRDADPDEPCGDDVVGQGSALSFPASDPPSTTVPGNDDAPGTNPTEPDEGS
jgi:hypothetical protein